MLVWSEAISKEWREHESSFSTRWRVQMVSSQRIKDIDGEQNDDLRESIKLAAATPKGLRTPGPGSGYFTITLAGVV
jgi:hypothetical protein